MTSLNQFNRPEHLAKHGADRLTPIVYAIDDDEGMLTSLAWLLGGSNIESRCFQSVEAFLASFDPHQPYNPSDMLDLFTRALAIAEHDYARKLQGSDFEAHFQSLSRREAEVLREVVRGK